jgi:hypothetical protein
MLFWDSTFTKELLIREIEALKLGFDMFTVPGTKYQNSCGDNFKKTFCFTDGYFEETYALLPFQMTESPKLGKSKWSNFKAIKSVYDMYVNYHFERYISRFPSGITFNDFYNENSFLETLSCSFELFDEWKRSREVSKRNSIANAEDAFSSIGEATDSLPSDDNLDMDQQSIEFWDQS